MILRIKLANLKGRNLLHRLSLSGLHNSGNKLYKYNIQVTSNFYYINSIFSLTYAKIWLDFLSLSNS